MTIFPGSNCCRELVLFASSLVTQVIAGQFSPQEHSQMLILVPPSLLRRVGSAWDSEELVAVKKNKKKNIEEPG